MAARRLLIVMLVLLGISSVIAIVIPEPNRDDPPPEETAVTGATGTTGTTGTTGDAEGPKPKEPEAESNPLEKTVQLGASEPVEIKAKPGTRMILTVNSKEGSEVEIEGLGLTGFADPFAPAVFDLILPPEPGRFQVGAPEGKPDATIITTS